jgi:hypothetical protein
LRFSLIFRADGPIQKNIAVALGSTESFTTLFERFATKAGAAIPY